MIRLNILKIIRLFTTNFPIFGTTYLAKIGTKLFAPNNGLVDGKLAKYHFVFDLSDWLQMLMYFGLYDIKETRLLKKVLCKGDIFIDVGANVGYYSLFASRLVGDNGKVYAFEPITNNSDVIQSTIEKNGISNIELYRVAIGAQKSELTLFLSEEKPNNSGWASVIPSSLRKKALVVNQISLDDFIINIEPSRIRLIKLDIEGAEYEALSGMKNQLLRSDAPDILCEINIGLLKVRGLTPDQLIAPLVNSGYQIFDVDLKPFDHRTHKWVKGQIVNLLFIKPNDHHNGDYSDC